MEQMEDKDKHMVTESRNRKKLLEEVETLVVSIFSCLLDCMASFSYSLRICSHCFQYSFRLAGVLCS